MLLRRRYERDIIEDIDVFEVKIIAGPRQLEPRPRSAILRGAERLSMMTPDFGCVEDVLRGSIALDVFRTPLEDGAGNEKCR